MLNTRQTFLFISTHYGKYYKRLSISNDSLIYKVFVIGAKAVIILYIILFGYYLDVILVDLFPNQEVVVLINKYMLILFICLIYIRFIFDRYPNLRLMQYLNLPIGKSKLIISYIIHNIITKPIGFLPVLIALPYWFKVLLPVENSLIWLSSILIFSLIANIIFLITQLFIYLKSLMISIILSLVIFIIIYLEFIIEIPIISNASLFVFDGMIGIYSNLFIVLSLLLLLMSNITAFYFIKKHIYIDIIN